MRGPCQHDAPTCHATFECSPISSLILIARSARSLGVPQSTAAATLTATYNDINAVKELFAANKGQIAGVILEPVVGNAGFIPPTKEFLVVSIHQCVHLT